MKDYDYLMLGLRFLIGYIAFSATSSYARTILIKMVQGNREIEWPRNKIEEPPSAQETKWEIVHLRDDVGGIAAQLSLIVGLLTHLTNYVYL